MNKLLLLFFLLALYNTKMYCQSVLTTREVYNFNISDEFQYRSHSSLANPPYGMPPNAQRYKIIGKRYSTNNDTVFYHRYYSNYSSTLVAPYYTYSFSTGYDSIFYTQLSDTLKNLYSITTDSCSWIKDTLYLSFCGALMCETNTCTACCFEGQQSDYIYGKGLGEIKFQYTDATNATDYGIDLFYYKKGSITCGIPDTLTMQPTGVKPFAISNEQIIIYPNPNNGFFNIETSGDTKQIAQIYDVNSKLVLSQIVNNKTTIDATVLNEGIYNVSIIGTESVINKRLVIVR